MAGEVSCLIMCHLSEEKARTHCALSLCLASLYSQLCITIKLSSGRDYQLNLDLAHEVVPEQSQIKILTTKVSGFWITKHQGGNIQETVFHYSFLRYKVRVTWDQTQLESY